MRCSASARLLTRTAFSAFLILLAIAGLRAQGSRSDKFIVKPFVAAGREWPGDARLLRL